MFNRSAWMKEYYQKHKEELKLYGREYWAKHHPKDMKQLRILFTSLEHPEEPKQHRQRIPRVITGKQIRCVFCRTDLVSDDGKIIERPIDHYVHYYHGTGCKNFDVDKMWSEDHKEIA